MTYYSCRDLGILLCGPRGIRTPDLLNAIETRSQLRYGPLLDVRVDLEGFEPSTSSVRLKRAPNCATGPHASPTILPEGRRGVNLRPLGHPRSRPQASAERRGDFVLFRELLRGEPRCSDPGTNAWREGAGRRAWPALRSYAKLPCNVPPPIAPAARCKPSGEGDGRRATSPIPALASEGLSSKDQKPAQGWMRPFKSEGCSLAASPISRRAASTWSHTFHSNTPRTRWSFR